MSDDEPSSPIIVTCEWLNETLKDKPDNLFVCDVSRYRSSRNAWMDYECRHIPGASFLDLFANVELTTSRPWNLATVDQFELSVRGTGICNDSHVIVYSTTEKCGYFLSARAWWMFRHFGHMNVSILDGGFDKWLSLGFSLSSDIPITKEGTFKANAQDDIMTIDALRSLPSDGECQIIDSRTSAKYLGVESPGHIPRAVNVPADELIDGSLGLLKSDEALHKVFTDASVDLNRCIVAYCNSGMSSCMLAMAAHLCGASNVYVYINGLTEWVEKTGLDQVYKEELKLSDI